MSKMDHIDWEVFDMLSPAGTPAASPSACPAFPLFDLLEDEEDEIDWDVMQMLGGGGPEIFTTDECLSPSKFGWDWDTVDWLALQMLGGGGPDMFTTDGGSTPSKYGWDWDDVDWLTFQMLGGDGPEMFTTDGGAAPSKYGWDWDDVDWVTFQLLGGGGPAIITTTMDSEEETVEAEANAGSEPSLYTREMSMKEFSQMACNIRRRLPPLGESVYPRPCLAICDDLDLPQGLYEDGIDWAVFQMLGGGGPKIWTTVESAAEPPKAGLEDEIDWAVFQMLGGCGPKIYSTESAETPKASSWDDWVIALGRRLGYFGYGCEDPSGCQVLSMKTLKASSRDDWVIALGRRLGYFGYGCERQALGEQDGVDWEVFQMLGGGGPMWDGIDWEVFQMLGDTGPEVLTTSDSAEAGGIDWEVFQMLGGGGPEIGTSWHLDRDDSSWEGVRMLDDAAWPKIQIQEP
jgi:hypothetical protein